MLARHRPPWKHFRVIHSRFPPRNVFDSVAEEDGRLLAELESVTSDRLSRWRECIAEEDARFGEGWGPVMASYCYIRAGRFNTSDFGAYYCADGIRTAIAEWSHHAAQTWRDFGFTEEADATVRCYVGHFSQALVDERNNEAVHHASSYEYPQSLAKNYRARGEFGVLYRSVRHHDGLSAALLRPAASTAVTQSAHYSVCWNGIRFFRYARLGSYETI